MANATTLVRSQVMWTVLGVGMFVAVMVLLFNIPFFILEDLSGEAWAIALRILLSSLFSVVIIYFLHLPFAHAEIKM